jgi:hypothetical protein
LKRGTKEESERQKIKKAKQLDRELPAGDLRALLENLRPTFRTTLAQTAPGRLYVTTMQKIDAYFQMSVDERPDDCGVAVFDVELVSPDRKTGLPVSAGLCTPDQSRTYPRASFAAVSGIGQVGLQ